MRGADHRFRLLLAALALLVCGSAAWLPPQVAAQFGPDGAANGTLPRALYLLLMLGLVVGLPLSITQLSLAMVGPEGEGLNVPNRRFWLAPERREATLALLRRRMRTFATGLALFLGLVHGLTVMAHRHHPPRLDTPVFLAALFLFLLSTALWLAGLLLRFRRP